MNESLPLSSMTLADLQALLLQLGEPAFRAKQVFGWLARGVRPAGMTNLPKALREKLEELPYGGAEIFDRRVSEKDGTVKYLFKLEDESLVEGVLMRYRYGNTLCISTQVGCAMGCVFCASTLGGCERNLHAGEMLSFLSCVEQDVPPQPGHVRSITNVVLMGSGEPLDNYDNVLRFLALVTSPDGTGISPRNISLSTCGIVPKLYAFMQEAPHVTLSVSLHAPNDEIRNQLMPINHRYPVGELINAAKAYADTTGRRVIFEYALIQNVNDSEQNAAELAAKLRGVNSHVNLIPLNSVSERDLQGTTRKEAERFLGWLQERHVSSTIRREMGADIEGACGQLRRRVLSDLES